MVSGINNDDQLTAVLRNEFLSIVKEVAENILEEIIQSMEKEVYEAGDPTTYPRQKLNGGLLGTFDISDNKIVGNSVIATIDQFPQRMLLDADSFIHGSYYYNITDVREYLTDWIIEGKSGPLFGDGFWREERDFFGPVVDAINHGDYDEYIEMSMTSHGLNWKKF